MENHKVLSHFVIRLHHAKEDLVLVDADFRRLSDGQKHGMLLVLRPNAVRKTFLLEGILLAEYLLGIFVLAVSAQGLACQRLTILFRIATGGVPFASTHPFHKGCVLRLQG